MNTHPPLGIIVIVVTIVILLIIIISTKYGRKAKVRRKLNKEIDRHMKSPALQRDMEYGANPTIESIKRAPSEELLDLYNTQIKMTLLDRYFAESEIHLRAMAIYKYELLGRGIKV